MEERGGVLNWIFFHCQICLECRVQFNLVANVLKLFWGFHSRFALLSSTVIGVLLTVSVLFGECIDGNEDVWPCSSPAMSKPNSFHPLNNLPVSYAA
jgi:hypothetical protein